MYGYELILDLHWCNVEKFNRKDIDKFFKRICDKLGMTQCERFFWDDVGVPKEERQTDPKTKGTSAVQFVLKSNITIHTLDQLNSAYINIFYCDEFDVELAKKIAVKAFGATEIVSHHITRT